jgi:hypothetical protein
VVFHLPFPLSFFLSHQGRGLISPSLDGRGKGRVIVSVMPNTGQELYNPDTIFYNLLY